MTKQDFIEKWNVGYEDFEQRDEFAIEMSDDLNLLIAHNNSLIINSRQPYTVEDMESAYEAGFTKGLEENPLSFRKWLKLWEDSK